MSDLATVSFLFTDLVGSTELLSRIGEGAYNNLRREHFALVRREIAEHDGTEVKTMGDGFMVAFSGASAAVACAVAIQQAQHAFNARRGAPAADGLHIRAGLSIGEVSREGDDYFGAPVVEASRLCAQAGPGQILVSGVLRTLAGARAGYPFTPVGSLELKGLPEPVAAFEVGWEPRAPAPPLPLPPILASVERTPFVGRVAQLERLRAALGRARDANRRQVILIAGEPGIGKTRLASELALEAHRDGATVLFGRCDEEGLLPYQPFVEALRFYLTMCATGELERQLGVGGADIARIVPELATRVAVGDFIAGEPDSERYRLFDSINALLEAASRDRPLVLVLDDLHWADRPTLLLLKHIARSPDACQMLVTGTYRETDLARTHPFMDILADLRQKTPSFERLLLRGLDEAEVEALVQSVAPHEVTAASQALAHRLADETEGNAFFLHEIVRHLKETGAIYQREGVWVSDADAINDLGIPEGIREVVGRRLSRLSDRCNQALSRAAVVGRDFSLPVLERVADIQSDELIDLLEEAVAAGLVDEAPQQADGYRFSHAIVRETLYAELPTARRLRLHRLVGEALEALGAPEHPGQLGELAYHYDCSSALPGAERGAEYALLAAAQAESRYAWEQVATYLRIATELLPDDDRRVPALLGRTAEALAWSLEGQEAQEVAMRASRLFAVAGEPHAAARLLAEVGATLASIGFRREAWGLAGDGLMHLDEGQPDTTWVILHQLQLNSRRAGDPTQVGMLVHSVEQEAIDAVVTTLSEDAQRHVKRNGVVPSRDEPLPQLVARDDPVMLALFGAGRYRDQIPRLLERRLESERRGEILPAIYALEALAFCHGPIGDFEPARSAVQSARQLASRLPPLSATPLHLVVAEHMLVHLTGSFDEEREMESVERAWRAGLDDEGNHYLAAPARASLAFLAAHRGDTAAAMQWVAECLPAMELAVPRANGLCQLFFMSVGALFTLDRRESADVIERSLRRLWLPEGHHHADGEPKLAMARLCAVQRRMDEALEWFGEARALYHAEEWRPMGAICDYDEALSLFRAGSSDRVRMDALLDAAARLMSEIGMRGWLHRVENLRGALRAR